MPASTVAPISQSGHHSSSWKLHHHHQQHPKITSTKKSETNESPSPLPPASRSTTTMTISKQKPLSSSSSSSSSSPWSPSQKRKNSVGGVVVTTTKENEELLRDSLRNHFKLLGMQHDSVVAEQTISVLHQKLQATEQLLAESESKLLLLLSPAAAAESQQRPPDEREQASSTSSSPSPPSASNATSSSAIAEVKLLQEQVQRCGETSSKLTRRIRKLEDESLDVSLHLRRLTQVVADSRKAIDILATSTSVVRRREENKCEETSSTRSVTGLMRRLAREIELLIAASFASRSGTQVSNSIAGAQEEEERRPSCQPSQERLSQEVEGENSGHSVLFRLLQRSQNEAAYFRSKYEEAIKKSSHDDDEERQQVPRALQRLESPSMVIPGEGEIRIMLLEAENRRLLEQVEIWKQEAQESDARANDAENVVVRFRLEAESFKSMYNQLVGA